MRSLLAGQSIGKKALRAFLVTFLSTLATALLPLLDRAVADVSDKHRVDFDKGYVVALLLSLVLGVTGAAIRAAIAAAPIQDD